MIRRDFAKSLIGAVAALVTGRAGMDEQRQAIGNDVAPADPPPCHATFDSDGRLTASIEIKTVDAGAWRKFVRGRKFAREMREMRSRKWNRFSGRPIAYPPQETGI